MNDFSDITDFSDFSAITREFGSVPVWIRRDGELASFTSWPVHLVSDVIPHLKKWGIDGKTPEMSGGFERRGGSVAFVVTIHDIDG